MSDDLNYTLIESNGRQYWLFEDGTELAVLRGGDGDPDPVIVLPPNPAPSGNPAPFFTAADIEKARREEKDKLYPENQSLKEQLTTLKKAEEKRAKDEADAKKEIEEAAKRAREAEMDAKSLIEAKDQEWQQRFAQVEAERERDRAIYEQERHYNQVQAYRARRIAETADTIAPQLARLIKGTTEAEIETAIAEATAATQEIMAQVQGAPQYGQPQIPIPPPVTGVPPVGPTETFTQQRSFSADEIKGMSDAEFARYRDQLLAAASAQVKGGGLYQR